jgi:hypothetical protein
VSKKRGGGKYAYVSVRLKPEEIVRINRLVPELSQPWRKGTRSDVLRALVLFGLEHQDQILAAIRTLKPPEERRTRFPARRGQRAR